MGAFDFAKFLFFFWKHSERAGWHRHCTLLFTDVASTSVRVTPVKGQPGNAAGRNS
jgi:hypothetical protein